ncbi:MAG: ubiquitin-like protein UBact [Nitrospirae bacterium]|nr:ubiquitin-like protein UBact [Nitrospirota bacterium]
MSPIGVERRERPVDPLQKPGEEEAGPKRPDVGAPDKENLLKRMRKVDPKQAERYRQRTGE